MSQSLTTPRSRVRTWSHFSPIDADVQDYVEKYASRQAADEAGDESDEDDAMSSVGSVASEDDEQPAGAMDGIE